MRFTRKLFVLAAVVLAACGPFNRSGPRTAVIFTNETTDQADVYAMISGSDPVRLGSVFSLRTETLSVPPSVTSRWPQMSIVARVFARSMQPSTGLITLQAGDTIRVRLASDGRSLAVTPR